MDTERSELQAKLASASKACAKAAADVDTLRARERDILQALSAQTTALAEVAAVDA